MPGTGKAKIPMDTGVNPSGYSLPLGRHFRRWLVEQSSDQVGLPVLGPAS